MANTLNLYDVNNVLLASFTCTDFTLNINSQKVDSVSAIAAGFPSIGGTAVTYQFLDHNSVIVSQGTVSTLNNGGDLQLVNNVLDPAVDVSITITISQKQFTGTTTGGMIVSAPDSKPTLPQPYDILYTDSDGTPWIAKKNTTSWIQFVTNTIGA